MKPYFKQWSLKTIALAMLIAIAYTTHAQENVDLATKEWGVGLTVGNYLVNDAHLGAVNFNSTNYGFKTFFARTKNNRRFEVKLDGDFGNLRTEQFDEYTWDPFSSSTLRADLEINYKFKALDFNIGQTSLPLFIGAGYHTDFNFNEFIGTAGFGFLVSHSIDLHLGTQYQFDNGHSLSWNMQIPTAAIVVRPPYGGFDEAFDERQEKPLALIFTGDLSYFPKYLAFQNILTYELPLNDKLALTAAYQFSYQGYKGVRPIRQAEHAFTIGIKF